jgi:MFS family permease
VSSANGYREILAVRDARALIAASGASQLGDWLYNAALLGYIYESTGSAGWVAAATVGRLLPYVLLGPVGGLIADRYDRRTVLIVGDAIRCAVMLALAAIVAFDAPIVLVIALTALTSAAGTAERPAAMALLPRLVGEARIGPANALLHTVQDIGVVIGPALGAVLIAVAPSSVAFGVNAATFAISGILISTMRRPSATSRPPVHDSARRQLSEGLRTARTAPFVIPLFIVVAMAEFTYGAQTVQLVLYAQNDLGLGPQGYGYLLAAAGVGGVLSATINGRLATSTKVSLIVVTTGAVFCLTQLAYAWTDQVALALAFTLLGGIGVVACEVVAETAVARIVPPDLLGRVMGAFDALSVAAMILGALLAPVLINRASLQVSFLVLGGIALVTTLACWTALRGLDRVSRQRSEALATRVAIIEQLPIAAGAPLSVLEQLASASQICPLPAGVDVVVQGAPAHAFYAVVDGSVIVHADDRELARLGSGDFFGERGLLDNAPRNATVTTDRSTTVLRIEGDMLIDALQSAPSVRSAIDRSMGSGFAAGTVPDRHTAIVDDPTWQSDGGGS